MLTYLSLAKQGRAGEPGKPGRDGKVGARKQLCSWSFGEKCDVLALQWLQCETSFPSVGDFKAF